MRDPSFQLTRLRCVALLGCALALLGACTSQREPAQRMVQDIEATLAAVGDDAAKYVPTELNEVDTQLDQLKTAFNAHDYKSVLDRGPALLGAAHALAADAAARKAEIAKSQTDDWTSFAARVPPLFAAVQNRLEVLSEPKNKKLAAGLDLEAARAALGQASSQWSKAQGAFGNGNMSEAVPTAKDVESRLEALLGTLKGELHAGPAAPPAS